MNSEKFPVLVTGGAGYIGSHAALALQDAGWLVVVVDNLVTGFCSAVAVVNVPTSSIAREAEYVLDIEAGPESFII